MMVCRSEISPASLCNFNARMEVHLQQGALAHPVALLHYMHCIAYKTQEMSVHRDTIEKQTRNAFFLLPFFNSDMHAEF
jgi:desulfoferrodoxin (superoxide reductase-like protein)